jgi:hypothetical protein
MLSYLGIEMAKENNLQHEQSLNMKIPEMSVQLVERLVKVYKSPHKCHRNILDTDIKFLQQVVGWIKDGNVVDRAVHCDG